MLDAELFFNLARFKITCRPLYNIILKKVLNSEYGNLSSYKTEGKILFSCTNLNLSGHLNDPIYIEQTTEHRINTETLNQRFTSILVNNKGRQH